EILHRVMSRWAQIDDRGEDEVGVIMESGDVVRESVVEDRTDVAFGQTITQRIQIEQLHRGRTDEYGARLDRLDACGVKNSFGLGGERQVDRDEIGLGEQDVKVLVGVTGLVLAAT